jgi:elongation factor P
MAKANEVERGSFVNYKDQPYLVVSRDFYSPGKGSAVVRFKLKNIKTGAVIRAVLKTDESIDEVELEQKEVKFLYAHREEFCFVESNKNERMMLSEEIIAENKDFLKLGETYRLVLYENEPISLKMPIKVEMLVKEAEEGLRGNTATSATKEVILETGMRLKVPIFIKEGDKIIVNIEKREYTGRV